MQKADELIKEADELLKQGKGDQALAKANQAILLMLQEKVEIPPAPIFLLPREEDPSLVIGLVKRLLEDYRKEAKENKERERGKKD
ncbi:hypothetical protein CM19_03555 [Candidatus Acidianus copahuensis]|uniref:DNA-binding protein n=1 Tax=Candidatus Acidianus copahuensis TaxID=1160895 RepID=A0A031LSI2_9CREN|nr:hypothetical protein [Candidatus Acidianus copahuensis]EZQ10715.1 hypothetical protein CM19_03555 [Candidatus Acidianus copahuensis]